MMPEGLLTGYRVVDLTQNAVGQCAASAFGDLGTDVISVIRPGYGDVRGFGRHLAVGRNTRSVAIDLKAEEGLDLFLRLAAGADVVLEGYRPGVASRLGVGYEAVRRVQPQVIYCSVSGYGQGGPYRDLPGHDLNYMGVAGAVQRDASGKPELPSNNWADRCATLNVQFAITAALCARSRDGQGRYIDLSITDSVLTLPAAESRGHPRIERVLNGGPPGSEAPPNPFLRGEYPAYGMYACADGSYLSLCCIEPWFWERLCNALGRPEWRDDHRPTRSRSRSLQAELAEVFALRSRSQWLEKLAQDGIPVAPVNLDHEVLGDPHLRKRGVVFEAEVKGESLHQLGLPFRVEDGPVEVKRPVSVVGEHSRDVMAELGYSEAEIERLVNAVVVGVAPDDL